VLTRLPLNTTTATTDDNAIYPFDDDDVLASATGLQIPAIIAYPTTYFGGSQRVVSFKTPVVAALTNMTLTLAPLTVSLSSDRVLYLALPNDIRPDGNGTSSTVCEATFNAVAVAGTATITLSVAQHVIRFSPAANTTLPGATTAATLALTCTNIRLPSVERTATRLTPVGVLSKADESVRYAYLRGVRIDDIYSGVIGTATGRFDPAYAGALTTFELTRIRGTDVLPVNTTLKLSLPYGTSAPNATAASPATHTGVTCGYGATRAVRETTNANISRKYDLFLS